MKKLSEIAMEMVDKVKPAAEQLQDAYDRLRGNVYEHKFQVNSWRPFEDSRELSDEAPIDTYAAMHEGILGVYLGLERANVARDSEVQAYALPDGSTVFLDTYNQGLIHTHNSTYEAKAVEVTVRSSNRRVPKHLMEVAEAAGWVPDGLKSSHRIAKSWQGGGSIDERVASAKEHMHGVRAKQIKYSASALSRL